MAGLTMISERYPSGRRGRAVNPVALALAGSNPRAFHQLLPGHSTRIRSASSSRRYAGLPDQPPVSGRSPARTTVALRFFEPNRLRRDLDNLPKAVLDALTHAGLWVDDAQIDCLMLARIGVSTDRPRVVVRVWRYAPSELDLPFLEAA